VYYPWFFGSNFIESIAQNPFFLVYLIEYRVRLHFPHCKQAWFPALLTFSHLFFPKLLKDSQQQTKKVQRLTGFTQRFAVPDDKQLLTNRIMYSF